MLNFCGMGVQNPSKKPEKSGQKSTIITAGVVILRCGCEIFHTFVTLYRNFLHTFTHSPFKPLTSSFFQLCPLTTSTTNDTAINLKGFSI
jgi:hypothetical protein